MNSRFSELSHNPWPGPSSYSDPQTLKSDEVQKFCGRENEKYDVISLIDDNIVITIYGRSGIGKSSLLNAGVFPELRKMQYLPIGVRLLLAGEDESFQDLIIKKIITEVETDGSIETIEVIDEETDNLKEDFLWSYFARHRFYNKDGKIVFPVIVLDQFEEGLRTSKFRKKTELLLRQIAYLADADHAIEDCIVGGEEYSYDFNFRFVLSIREDDLYRLEDCLDQSYLPSFKQNRYRLRGMNRDNAVLVATIPSEGVITKEEAKSIIDDLKDQREDEYEFWNPAILSLYFFLLYDNEKDTDKRGLFAEYYKRATKFVDKESIAFLEDNLLTDAGNRKLMRPEEVLVHVSEEAIESLLKSKIIQKEPSRGCIEFSHDRLCEEAVQHKKKRQKEKERNKKILRGVAVLLVVVLACIIIWLMRESNDKDTQIASKDAQIVSISAQAEKELQEIKNKVNFEKNQKIRLKKDNEKLQIDKEKLQADKEQIRKENFQLLQSRKELMKLTNALGDSKSAEDEQRKISEDKDKTIKDLQSKYNDLHNKYKDLEKLYVDLHNK